MEPIDLPENIITILESLDAPKRLSNHLQIVHTTAFELLNKLKENWSLLDVDDELVLFGAATHDIGKTLIKEEIYASGKEHEILGKNLLIRLGYSEELARFAYTHGNWKEDDLKLEDLLVSLADKIWKGKRVNELEERVVKMIAENISVDYWETYTQLDEILSELSLNADERINWQNRLDK